MKNDDIIINSKLNLEEFVDYLKNDFNIPKNSKKIYLQFESWKDNIVKLPHKLYHNFLNALIFSFNIKDLKSTITKFSLL